MQAIFNIGGKQYLVKIGDIVRIEKIKKEVNKIIFFNEIIMFNDKNTILFGKPYLINKKIEAQIIKHGKAKKINLIKFKRRKHYRKFQGHRQQFTDIKIINLI